MSSRALRSIVFHKRLIFDIADEEKYRKASGVAGAKLEEENVDIQSTKHIQGANVGSDDIASRRTAFFLVASQWQ